MRGPTIPLPSPPAVCALETLASGDAAAAPRHPTPGDSFAQRLRDTSSELPHAATDAAGPCSASAAAPLPPKVAPLAPVEEDGACATQRKARDFAPGTGAGDAVTAMPVGTARARAWGAEMAVPAVAISPARSATRPLATPAAPWEQLMQGLCERLVACHAPTQAALHRKVAALAPALYEARRRLMQPGEAGSLLLVDDADASSGRPRLIQLITLGFDLLHRCLEEEDAPLGPATHAAPAPAPRQALEPAWAAQTPGATPLLQLLDLCLRAAEESVAANNRSSVKNKRRQLDPALLHIAEVRPCSALAALLRQLHSGSGRAPGEGQASSAAVRAAGSLLGLTTQTARLGAELQPALRQTQLLAHLCDHLTPPAPTPGGPTRGASPHPGQLLRLLYTCEFLLQIDGWGRAGLGGDPQVSFNLGLSDTAEWRAVAEGGPTVAPSHVSSTPELGDLLMVFMQHEAGRAGPSSQRDRDLLGRLLLCAVQWWSKQPRWASLRRVTRGSSSSSIHQPATAACKGPPHRAGGHVPPSDAAGPPAFHCTLWASASTPQLRKPPPVAPLPGTRQFVTTAAHVSTVLCIALYRTDEVRTAVELLSTMWGTLSSQEQGRAIVTIVPLVRVVMDAVCTTLSERYARSPSAAAGTRQACSARRPLLPADRLYGSLVAHIDGSKDAGSHLARQAVLLLDTCLRPTGEPNHSAVCYTPRPFVTEAFCYDGLRPRARWVFQGRTLDACQAAMRILAVLPPPAPNCRNNQSSYADMLCTVCILSITVAASLLGDPLCSLPAVSAPALASAASMRKLMRRAAAQAHSVPVGSPQHDGARSGVPPHGSGTRQPRVPSGQLDPEIVNLLFEAGASVLYQLMSHSMLRAHCDAGCTAALSLRRCVVAQLLPAVVRAAARSHRSVHSWDHIEDMVNRVLVVVAAANAAGMGDLTAAADAPRLLHALLAERDRDSGVHTPFVVAAALVAAPKDPSWVRQSVRLRLPHLAREWVAMGDWTHTPSFSPPEDAARLEFTAEHLVICCPQLLHRLRPPGSNLSLTEAMVVCLDKLCEDDEGAVGSRAVNAVLAPRSAMDLCMLKEAHEQANGLDCPLFLFGCWDRHCVNLSGTSEAALRTLKCGGCLLARQVC